VRALEEAAASIEETARALGRYARDVQPDGERLEALNARVDQWHRLMRKHGGNEETLLARHAELRQELERLDGLDQRRPEVTARLREALADLDKACRDLSAIRRQEARRFEQAVEKELVSLAMPDTTLRARLTATVGSVPPDPEEALRDGAHDSLAGYSTIGIDRVELLLSPNKGEEPRPLSRVASGGELSRVMLAIKRVQTAGDAVATLVFDEVDAGIGGRVAAVVGRKLAALALTHQVICVTHLPQIACYASTHYEVAKQEQDGRTVSRVERLDEADRPRAIAAMLGGDEKKAQQLAREMLRRARGAGDGDARSQAPS
jgi:DNA repair protein RecN (Recombination protein N)